MASQGHSRSWGHMERRQGTKQYYVILLSSFPKVPKTSHPKALKIDVFDYPYVV